MADAMEVEILEDGTIKVTTPRISGPNHMSAFAFLKEMEKVAGEKPEIRSKHGHVHHHHGEGEHDHQH